jgi:hypothetical protein
MKASQYRETFGNRIAGILFKEVRIQVFEEQHIKSKSLSRKARGTIARSERDRTANVELMFDPGRADSCYHDRREPCDARLRLFLSACDWIRDFGVLGIGALCDYPSG